MLLSPRVLRFVQGCFFPFVVVSACFGCCTGLRAQQTVPASEVNATPSKGINTAAAFLAEIAVKYPSLATITSAELTANAKWTVGSLSESGSAVLNAATDGSSSLQLNLNTATRSESRAALGATRTCQWTDSTGAHTLNDVDCNGAVPWFAPTLLLQPQTSLLSILNLSDDGMVTRNDSPFHQVSYVTPLQGDSTSFTNLLTAGTRMSVLFDPQTLLPASIEYLQHADTDLNTTFTVRIVYTNYQTVSGVPVPYQIDRYVNNALQLSLTVTNASLK